jgi:hypothetical protein
MHGIEVCKRPINGIMVLSARIKHELGKLLDCSSLVGVSYSSSIKDRTNFALVGVDNLSRSSGVLRLDICRDNRCVWVMSKTVNVKRLGNLCQVGVLIKPELASVSVSYDTNTKKLL